MIFSRNLIKVFNIDAKQTFHSHLPLTPPPQKLWAKLLLKFLFEPIRTC